jgi:flavin-dependent dehydrogenase
MMSLNIDKSIRNPKSQIPNRFDVVIVGAGLAGLQCARLLAKENVKILLVDRKTDLTRGIHTTGIFVRKTFEDFGFPPETLGRPIRQVTLYSPKLRSFAMESGKDEFRVGNMGLLYKKFLDECTDAGAEFCGGTRFAGIEDGGDGETIVRLQRKGSEFTVKTKVLIGADGAASRVAKALNLDENRDWLVGFEEVYRDIPARGAARLECFLDAELAPGYLAWISYDTDEMHIGLCGYPRKFDPQKALKEFKKKIEPEFVDLKKCRLEETRGGRIPVGGVLKKIADERGLLIGDAAGAVSPLTAGGLDPCMRLSKFAAEVVLARLKRDDPKILRRYSGKMFRAKFTTRLLFRYILKTFSGQRVLEFGFKFLRGRIGRKFAEKIFFRRSSFPDVNVLKENAEIGLEKLTVDS